ncbi:MAG: type II toxin-antitoxin system HicB family antitoxin, partial [Verrucomicrobiota bacterium]|nr:type II toxin-antitoxin system HicB family antitoxin [Verrucomicrobiota bacterium]
MKRFFTLEYWPDDGGFVGKLRGVPGVFSQGETLDELRENIADAYHLLLTDGSALLSEALRPCLRGLERL